MVNTIKIGNHSHQVIHNRGVLEVVGTGKYACTYNNYLKFLDSMESRSFSDLVSELGLVKLD
jgi:hypothetical protein